MDIDFKFMIGKNNRISKKNIPNIVRRGKRFSGEGFDLKVWFDNSLESPKFTVIISKKIHKSAVKRNQIKRRFRAAIFEILKENQNMFSRANYVVIIRSSDLLDLKSGDIANLLRKSMSNNHS